MPFSSEGKQMSKICPSSTDDGNYLRKHMLVDSSHILLQSLQNTNLNEAKFHEEDKQGQTQCHIVEGVTEANEEIFE